MEDIVAVAIELEDGSRRFFLTWGRIFDSVDGERLEKLALKTAASVRLEGTGERAVLCDSLQEAARERYFYECFADMLDARARFTGDRASWTRERAQAMEEGKEWWYLGVPQR